MAMRTLRASARRIAHVLRRAARRGAWPAPGRQGGHGGVRAEGLEEIPALGPVGRFVFMVGSLARDGTVGIGRFRIVPVTRAPQQAALHDFLASGT